MELDKLANHLKKNNKFEFIYLNLYHSLAQNKYQVDKIIKWKSGKNIIKLETVFHNESGLIFSNIIQN